MIRVLIVAAYAAVRAGLRAILADEDGVAVVGEAAGGAELERLLPEVVPAVVLVDLDGGNDARILDLMAESAAGLVALGDGRAGYGPIARRPLPSWAYLLKEAEAEEIAAAVRAVAAGLVVLDRSLAWELGAVARRLPGAGEDFPGEALTAREREVLQLMAHGLPNKAIARDLSISQHTVKFHVASILGKLGAGSRTEAVTLGARQGLVLL